MRRLSQFVALVLTLFLLAPAASAQFACGKEKKHAPCPRHCCAEMDGMQMSMSDDAMASSSTHQIALVPCCTAEVQSAVLAAASPTEGQKQLITLVAITGPALHERVPVGALLAAEDPPRRRLLPPSISQLCTFLI